jgi:SpoVK/Ycf46/Vps4 family AAA+-type ATPase
MSLELFEDIVEFPDKAAKLRYEQLVGLDATKEHLIKESRLLFNPHLISEWSMKHYGKEISLLSHFRKRPPLFIFSGDVGTGKTSLAESFGSEVARQEKMEITLYRLSLKSRGSGTVGEMTKLISSAFNTILSEGKKVMQNGKKANNALILLIDEADALAQSRELAQMHHEDRAGVNALIRGIDTISTEHLPILVVMCTNRLSAIDPAVKRRASMIFDFVRPNEEQRHHILQQTFGDTGISGSDLENLVNATGPDGSRSYGYTYSDLMQRLLPSVLISFFPDRAIDFNEVIRIAKETNPTPPFKQDTENAENKS